MESPDSNLSHDGNRFFAALLGLTGMLPPVLVAAFLLRDILGTAAPGPESVMLLLLPLGPWIGWRLGAIRGDRRWKRFGLVAGLITGAGFGYLMEGVEGGAWGGVVGLVVGFFAGFCAPRIASVLPSRWGVVAGWSALGSAMVVVPLLLAIRGFFGNIDDDDFAFLVLGAFGGVMLAASRGWWKSGTLRGSDVRAVLRSYGRAWLDPRVLVWVLAVVIPAFATGGYGLQFVEIQKGPALEVRIVPASFLGPVCLGLAAVIGWLLARKRPSAWNDAYILVCTAVLALVTCQLVAGARFDMRADTQVLEIRYGLFRDIRLQRGELVAVETKVSRGRRHRIPYPVLVTEDDRRHHLRRLPYSHQLVKFLSENWGITALYPVD